MLRKLSNLLTSSVHSMCNAKLRRMLECRWGGFGSILMMHRVVARKEESAALGLTITASFLDQALAALRAADVDLLSLKDLYARVLQPGTAPRRAVALTFDDGFRDNLTLALPILRKHQAPATIFVPSGAPDRTMDTWFLRLERAVMSSPSITCSIDGAQMRLPAETPAEKAETYRRLGVFIHRDLRRNRSLVETLLPTSVLSDEDLMESTLATWDELRAAAADPLVTIGAHSVHHPVFADLSDREALTEIVESRRRLSAEFDQHIDLFAYPYGGRLECSQRDFRLVQSAGFVLAVTTRYGGLHDYHVDRPFSLPRKTFGGLRESLDALAVDVLGTGPAAQKMKQTHPAGRPEFRWR